MIMAIPPYIGLSVSILNNNQANYSVPEKDGAEPKNAGIKKSNSSGDEILASAPKKRSFDVAFLISPDDNKQSRSSRNRETEPVNQPEPEVDSYESETIKSAFKKVGIGFSPLAESRSPSPIDAIRTPSPCKVNFPERKPISGPETVKAKRDGFQCVAHRPRFQNYQKELEKSSVFLGNNLMDPVSVVRQNFIPAPLFATNPILPASFVNASLLPPSLAALTLPAQNVCAKCNVSFRMTSDLVYHMRSHHKNDHANSDQIRKRREMDKLKCPVCNESFRERHHLTRHMTAHQDKEGDTVDVDPRSVKSKTLDGSRINGECHP